MINVLKTRNTAIESEITALRSKIDGAKDEIEVRAASAEIRFLEAEKKINDARIVELAERSQDVFKMTGKASANDMQEVVAFRNAVMSLRGNVSSMADALPAIPTYVQNEIVNKIETYGNLLNLVKKTTINGSLSFPRYEGKVTANWVEDATADGAREALAALGDVTLNAHMLRATVAYTELSELASIEAWVDEFASEAAKAVVLKLEAGIIAGDGAKKVLGIVNDELVAEVSLTDEQINNADTWITLTADLDEAYQGGAFAMNYGSFVNLKTLKDEAGHYVAFAGENGGKHILDKSAVTVSGSVLKSFKAASSGDVIAVYGDFSDYRVNFQTNIIIDRHFDYDKRQWVVDVVAYVDGKVVDPFGFIVIKKA